MLKGKTTWLHALFTLAVTIAVIGLALLVDLFIPVVL